MNVKKIILLSFLLFANVLLLVHAVFPHHYHEDTGLCFTFHCRDSKEAHSHENNKPQTHQHEGNPSPDICQIDDVYTTANNIIKNTYKAACCEHIDCDCEQVLHLLILNHLNISDFGTELPFQPKPYLVSYHTKYISRSLGLRAPPVC